jgi:hypothetical protein
VAADEIALGINDFLPAIPLGAYEQNWAAIIEEFLRHSPTSILDVSQLETHGKTLSGTSQAPIMPST